jgi:hypothetical protein
VHAQALAARRPGFPQQACIGLLVCFVSTTLYAAHSPYTNSDDGWFALICQLSLFFVLVSTIALNMDGETSADALGVLLVATLVVPAVIAILSF